MNYKEFEVHILNTPGLELMKQIASKYDNFLTDLQETVFRGNDELGKDDNFAVCKAWDTAKGKVEESCFFAKKAAACIRKNQVSE